MNLLRIILFAVFFKRMARQHPELVDGAAAAASVVAAFEQDGYL